jgi:DNA-binding protein YbaB
MDMIEQLKSEGASNAAKEVETARKQGLVSVIVDGEQHHTLNPAKW